MSVSIDLSEQHEHGHSHSHGHGHGHHDHPLLQDLSSLELLEDEVPNLWGTFVSLLGDSGSRGTVLFLGVLMSFSLAELLYAKWADSLALITSSFFDLIDAATILVSVWGQHVNSRNGPGRLSYSYGYHRFQVLAHFSVNVFLLFVCLWAFVEGLERILEAEPVLVHGYMLLRVGFLGVGIRMMHVMVFRKHSMFARNSLTSDSPVAALLWEFTSDLLVLVVGFAVVTRGYMMVDTLVSMFLLALIAFQAIPIVRHTALTLLQTVPGHAQNALAQRLREASALDGVLECEHDHFWDVGGNVLAGTLRVRVKQGASETAVVKHVQRVFHPTVEYLTVEVRKDDWDIRSE